MAAHVVVVHTTARSHRVNVIPNTHLSDVLEDACRKFKLDTSAFSLKSNNKTIDLSRTFRLSGLSSGAKLQLVQASRSPSVVSVALQLPESPRLIDKFPSDTTIWQILRRFEDGAAGGGTGTKLHITDRGVPATNNGISGAGRLFYEQPVLQVVGRTLSSFADLQKTLGQLGFNDGSVMLRVSFQKTSAPLEEAIMQHQNYFASSQIPAEDIEMPSPPTKHTLQPSDQDTGLQANELDLDNRSDRPSPGRAESLDLEMPDPPDINVNSTAQPGPQVHLSEPVTLVESLSDPSLISQSPDPSSEPPASGQPKEAPSTPSTTVPNPSTLPPTSSPPPDQTSSSSTTASRPFTTYRSPSSSIPTSQTPYNPSDYIPTIEHAQLHQKQLQQSSRPTRLPTDAELARQEAARREDLARIPAVSIRVRFPNQEHVEASFGQADSGAALYAFVREHMHSKVKGERFVLKTAAAAAAAAVDPNKGGGRQVDIPDTESKKLIKDLGFRGRVLVIFAWDEKAAMEARRMGSVLKEETRRGARGLEGWNVPKEKETEDERGIRVNVGKKDGGGEEGGGAGEGKGKKVPKWMQKLVKK